MKHQLRAIVSEMTFHSVVGEYCSIQMSCDTTVTVGATTISPFTFSKK
jgi:hypothetical protein